MKQATTCLQGKIFSHCSSFFRLVVFLSVANAGALLTANDALGTHLYALKESNNCAGCHKGGRGQRPFLERRCTLDCQGCHVDPSGAGPRNQWGYYYSQSNLASVNFFQPIDPLQDRSRIDLHYDGRYTQQTEDGGPTRSFPMSSEFSLRLRPIITHLHFTYQSMLLGRLDDKSFRSSKDGGRRLEEKYSVMVDQLPLNTYVRAYRGQPMYGIRRPNHTLWIRERLGLDEFALTEAAELGTTPNVPFFRGSVMKGDPRVDEVDKQKGYSAHGGLRGVTAGWHVNGSVWNTRSEKSHIHMYAAGAGMHLFGVLLYGERNWRQVTQQSNDEPFTNALIPKVQPSSTISEYTGALTFIPGLMLGGVYEVMDSDSNPETFKRRSAFADFHPIPFLHFELWRRFEHGVREFTDTFGVLHLYADL